MHKILMVPKIGFLFSMLIFILAEIWPMHEIHTINYKKKKVKLVLTSYWIAAGMLSLKRQYLSWSEASFLYVCFCEAIL